MELPSQLSNGNLYPFTSHFLNLSTGHKIHYVDEGEGEVVLLVHGTPVWSAFYRDLILKLRKKFRVIAFDHLGMGHSDRPADYQYTFQNHVKNMEEVCEILNIKKYSLIVHDWGGPIGLKYASHDLSSVKAIVILNTAAFPTIEIPIGVLLAKIPFIRNWMVKKSDLFINIFLTFGTKKGFSKEKRELLFSPQKRREERFAIEGFLKELPLGPWHYNYKVVKELEKKLKTDYKGKVGIFWGAQDFFLHMGFFKRWRKIFPQAQSKIYFEAGHFVLEDATEDVTSDILGLLTR